MRLVFLRRPYGLRGAQDLAAFIRGDDQRAFVSPETLGDTAPICFRLVRASSGHMKFTDAPPSTQSMSTSQSPASSCGPMTSSLRTTGMLMAFSVAEALRSTRFAKPLARAGGVRLAGILIEEGIGLRVASAACNLGVEIECLGMRREQNVALQPRDRVDGFLEDLHAVRIGGELEARRRDRVQAVGVHHVLAVVAIAGLQVHEVPPGVCPGVKCTVIAMSPTRSVSPSA